MSITHCSRLLRAGGSPRWFPLRNTRRCKRGNFVLTAVLPVIAFQRVWFAPCCFTEVGKCRGTCHRKGGGGVALAISWLLKPPAMAKTQRRCVGNKQCPGYHLLLLSSTQVAKDFWGIRRFRTASHGQAERVSLSGSATVTYQDFSGYGDGGTRPWIFANHQPFLTSLELPAASWLS